MRLKLNFPGRFLKHLCVVFVVAECKRTEGPRGGGAAAGAVCAAAVDVAGAPAVRAAAARGGRAGGRRRPPERGDARRGHGYRQLWPAGVGGKRNRAGPRRRLLPAALLPLLTTTEQQRARPIAPHLISLDAFNLFVNKHKQTHTNTVF